AGAGRAHRAEAHCRLSAGIPPGGNGAEQEAGEQGQRKCKEKRACAERDFMETRQIRGAGGNKETQTRSGDAESESASDKSKHRAFNKQFARNTATSGAQGGTDGEFDLAV